MNAEEFNRFLVKKDACREAVTWAKDKSLEEAWEQCERGDWLLWLYCDRLGSLKQMHIAYSGPTDPTKKQGWADEVRSRLQVPTGLGG